MLSEEDEEPSELHSDIAAESLSVSIFAASFADLVATSRNSFELARADSAFDFAALVSCSKAPSGLLADEKFEKNFLIF